MVDLRVVQGRGQEACLKFSKEHLMRERGENCHCYFLTMEFLYHPKGEIHPFVSRTAAKNKN